MSNCKTSFIFIANSFLLLSIVGTIKPETCGSQGFFFQTVETVRIQVHVFDVDFFTGDKNIVTVVIWRLLILHISLKWPIKKTFFSQFLLWHYL